MVRRFCPMRSIRSRKGSMFALTSVLFLAITIIGIGFFTLIKTLGGMRELQNATESGNLNVAKIAIKSPYVELQHGMENNEGPIF